MPNTVVYLKTQEEYMKMCEEPDMVDGDFWYFKEVKNTNLFDRCK